MDNNLDPSKSYIIDPSEHIYPLSLSGVFDNNNPVALEIGFGEGEFIVDLALKNINWNFVGIEIKRGRHRKALKKVVKQEIQNLRLINIDARIAIKQVFENNAFQAAYINFPDPWPKKRHSKHRLFNEKFIKELSKSVVRNGNVKVKTDHKDYIRSIVNEFNSSGLFENNYIRTGFETYEKNVIETKFEKEFRREGREIFTATFTNISD